MNMSTPLSRNFFRVVWTLAGLSLLAGCIPSPGGYNTTAPPAPVAASMAPVPDPGLDPSPIRWYPGGRWTYSDGYGLRVSEVDGTVGKLVRTDRSGDWVKRDGLFKVDSMSRGTRRQVVFRAPDPAGLFPLRKGKKIVFKREFMAGKNLRVHQTAWRVVGQERITVPAGSFDTWVLVWNTRSRVSDWKGYEKWWYSPKVGNYVRLEYKYGKTPASSRVLMSYQRGG